MDAIILGGGDDTRLWPITRYRPATLLPVGESTVLDRTLSALDAEPRISDVYVTTDDRFADQYTTYLEDESSADANVVTQPSTNDGTSTGEVATVTQLTGRDGIEDDVFVVPGGTLIDVDVAAFIDAFQEERTPTLAWGDGRTRERPTSTDTVRADGGGALESSGDHPDGIDGPLDSIACCGFPAESRHLLETYRQEAEGRDELDGLARWLLEEESARTVAVEGRSFDVGTPEGYLDAVARTLEGDAVVDPSASIENARIGANVHVMADATVREATLEDTVVFPETTIHDAHLSRTVVDRGASVEGLTLDGSLIAQHTKVYAK